MNAEISVFVICVEAIIYLLSYVCMTVPLIIDAKVNDEKFLFVNIYNSNTESEQIKTLDTLKSLLEDIDSISDKLM